MEPNETKYFANPGLDGKFNPDYQFNWADFNNEPMNNWKDIASTLLFYPYGASVDWLLYRRRRYRRRA